jgi:hypothetical protein
LKSCNSKDKAKRRPFKPQAHRVCGLALFLARKSAGLRFYSPVQGVGLLFDKSIQGVGWVFSLIKALLRNAGFAF